MDIEMGNQVEWVWSQVSTMIILKRSRLWSIFVVKLPQKQTHLVNHPGEQWWTIHVDGASKVSRFEIGLVLQSPIGELVVPTSNNETEYEVVSAKLDLALMLAATKLEIKSDSQLIIE